VTPQERRREGRNSTGPQRLTIPLHARLRVVSERVTLSVAQLAIALEYGFASWPRLKNEAERRHLIDSGDVDGLARLLATDPSLARDRMHSCLTQPGTAVWDYVSVARFHQLLDHDRIGDIARVLLAAGAPVDGDPLASS